MLISKVLFMFAAFNILWTMAGYNISIELIGKLKKVKENEKTNKKYTVTVMIVAHNEEKVIESKLLNVIDNDYPKNKIEYLIASDNSTDHTIDIVESFIARHSDVKMRLYNTTEHKGKTNAQNEAQKLVTTEILIMTDANAMFKRNAISELVSFFAQDDIAYVCGALIYQNTENLTAKSESNYWNGELKTRLIESRIKTITAGNGAIYACRNAEYIDIPLIASHDSSMPYYYATHNKRALFNGNAIAYEKAGESAEDEYQRKVRMNRGIIRNIRNGLKVLNIFKYGWFSYFYYGHRTLRYLLWLNHLILFVCNIFLAMNSCMFWNVVILLQLAFYLLGVVGKFVNNTYIHMIYYYCLTILAQWHGLFNILTGNVKPVWEKAETTR